MFNEIPVEQLDKWLAETRRTLAINPTDMNATALLVMIENEYHRKGLEVPEERTLSNDDLRSSALEDIDNLIDKENV